MKSLARRSVWWPTLDADVEALVESCALCQSARPALPARTEPFPPASDAWVRVHVDFSSFEGEEFLLLVEEEEAESGDEVGAWPNKRSTALVSSNRTPVSQRIPMSRV